MATIYKMNTTVEAVNGGDNTVLLIGKSLIHGRTADGKQTDTVEGVRLDVLLPKSRMNALAVKFTKDPIPKISDEEIAVGCAEMAFPILQIEGAQVKIYSNPGGGIGMTATAESAQIVNLK